MNKNEFLTTLSGRLPYGRDEIEFMFKIISETIADGLDHDKQVRTPIGVFKKVPRKSRRIRDISSGELRVLPEWEQIIFKPNSNLDKE